MSRGGVNAYSSGSSGVVTHLMTMGTLTVCGRVIAAVNCQPFAEPISESTCKACAKKVSKWRKEADR